MVLMMLACQPRVSTSDLVVDIAITGDGPDHAAFWLTLTTLDGDAFTLRDDDQLLITVDGETEDVAPQAAWTQQVPVDAFEVQLRLERAWDLSSELWVDVPAGLELLEPVDGDNAFAPLTEDIDLAWSPSGFDEPMSYTVEGDCVWMHKRFFGDAGVARIAPWVWEEHPIGEGCTAELTLRRQPFQQGARDWQTFASVGAMVERRDQVSLRLAP